MSNEDKEKTDLESLKDSIDELRREIKDIKKSINDQDDYESDWEDDLHQLKERMRRTKRNPPQKRRGRHSNGFNFDFNFESLANLGNTISRTLNHAVDGLGETISETVESVMETLPDILDNLDFSDLWDDNHVIIHHGRSKRWKYGEERPKIKEVKTFVELSDSQLTALGFLEFEKLSVEEFSKAVVLYGEELTQLIDFLKSEKLIIQESSGSQRLIITKFGKKHLKQASQGENQNE